MTLYNVFVDSYGQSDICAHEFIEQGCDLLHQKQTAAKECAQNGKECLDGIVADVKTFFVKIDDGYARNRCMDFSDVFAGIQGKYHAFVKLGGPSLVAGLKSFAQADIREPPREPEQDYSEFEDQ